MIEKINKIKDCFIYKDFRWNTKTPPFKQFNLIYGWNYSGKTVLSRIFRCFENGHLHPHYPDAEFEIEDKQGNKFSNVTLNRLPNVRVYNVDFVKENLKWHNESEDIEPILVLGAENIKLQNELKEERENYEAISKEKENKADEKQKIEMDIEKGLSAKAKAVKDTLSWPDYDRRHLKKAIKALGTDYESSILTEEEYKKELQEYQRSVSKPSIEPPELPDIERFSEIQEKAKEITSRSVVAQIIERLKADPKLANWIKEGKELHKGEKVCKFCGNLLPENLLDKYENHFSQDFENLQNDISSLKNEIQTCKNAAFDFLDQLPDKARFYDELQPGYKEKKGCMKKALIDNITLFEPIIKAIEKKQKQPFDKIEFKETKFDIDNIKNVFKELEVIIEEHNTKTENFEQERVDKKKRLEKHFAGEFVKSSEYFKRKEVLGGLLDEINRLEGKKSSSQNKIYDYEAQISDIAKGADKVNEYLGSFFRDDVIKLLPTEDSKFVLKRGDKPAINLSEGEKSIISFCYFMARLEDKNTDLANTIVFIDDPVCSLDSNHIHGVYALIESKLRKDTCAQFFVTTHNSTFLNLMKDLVKERKCKESLYLIEVHSNNNGKYAEIIHMPETLRKYRTEYVYLFSLIKEFKDNPSPDFKMLYLLPNIVRRFLETYLGFKIPDGTSSKKKIKRLIDDETNSIRIWKFINQYSHSSSSDRIIEFPSIEECCEIIDIVLEKLEEKEKEHYDTLCAQC